MTAPVPLTRLGATARIGLLADTHCHAPDATDLPAAVLDAFRGADLVIHLGDMGDATVLDRLERVTAVIATRGRDDPAEDPRLAPTVRVVEAGGLVVGALFDLATAGLATVEDNRLTFLGGGLSAARMEEVFGRRLDVVTFGATHQDLVAHHRGVLFVNPGSATLRVGARKGKPGTAAVLELRAGVATVEIVQV